MLEKLIEKYEKDRDHYVSASYSEAQLRSDFLDPLIEILGWDIHNGSAKPTNEREMLVEESLNSEDEDTAKKPDYTFRLFSKRTFFLEAKKPFVKIESDLKAAQQTRRYGFSAKLKISVLSNFEYLAIYDCSSPVGPTDDARNSRVKIYHYTEYLEKIEELKELVGRESVYTGKFEKVWEHIEKQLSRFSIDELFLSQINKWRLTLGSEVYSIDPSLSEEALNDIVQSYINSIVFLRVCEDRNLESVNDLKNLSEEKDISKLLQKFRTADAKYNSGLFKHRHNEKLMQNDSSAIWEIIKEMYYPQSIYSFSVISSDILGRIYEVFLGEKLRIKEGNISLIPKAENVDRDVVTTPKNIIDDIINLSLRKKIKDYNDEEILATTVADIACGSGAFLLEAYQTINDTLIDYYLNNDPDKLIQVGVSSYKLTYQTKKSILENCIFGIDKDYNATQACRFGLLLKLLEDEDNSSLTTPALPPYEENIIFGNSLLEPDDIKVQHQKIINPIVIKNRFDIIIGNPPYLATEHIKQITPEEFKYYKLKYSSAYKQFDKYYLFIERGLQLLKDDGCLGYIIPNKFLKVGSALKLRQDLSSQKLVKNVISFGANQVFPAKTTYTAILILDNTDREVLDYCEVKDLDTWNALSISDKEELYTRVEYSDLDDDVWILMEESLREPFDRIRANSLSLIDLVGEENIFNGIQTSANKIYVHKIHHKDDDYYYFEWEGSIKRVERKLTRPYFETQGSNSLSTYRYLEPNSFVIFPYLNQGGTLKLVSLNDMANDYPETYNFLLGNKEKLKLRDIQPVPENDNEWYRYGRHQSLENCDVPEKLVVGVLSTGNKYSIDRLRTFISSGGTAGYCMITIPPDSKYSIYYIQALLNSRYIEWYSSLVGEVFRGGYIARGTKVLKRLPVHKIDFEETNQRAIHDNIVRLQKEIIKTGSEIYSLQRSNPNARELDGLSRALKSKESELDTQIVSLYDLGGYDKKVPVIAKIYAAN